MGVHMNYPVARGRLEGEGRGRWEIFFNASEIWGLGWVFRHKVTGSDWIEWTQMRPFSCSWLDTKWSWGRKELLEWHRYKRNVDSMVKGQGEDKSGRDEIRWVERRNLVVDDNAHVHSIIWFDWQLIGFCVQSWLHGWVRYEMWSETIYVCNAIIASSRYYWVG